MGNSGFDDVRSVKRPWLDDTNRQDV